MAQMVHAGKIVPGGASNIAPKLSCSPLPCAFTEVNVSNRTQPANETPVVVDPNNANNLLSAANDYACTSIQGVYASTDGGTTWTRNCVPTLSGYSGAGDPNVAYDLNGNAYFLGIDIGTNWVIIYEKSTDHGITWTAPKTAVTPLFSGGLTDKPWTSVDVSSTSPFKNTIYTAVTQFDSSGFNGAIGVAHSSDGGATWKNVQASDHSTGSTVIQFSDLAIAKDGTVYASWLACPATGTTGDCGGTASKLKIAKSTDQGNTWSSPMLITNVTLAPDTCGAFYGCLPNTSERISNIPVIDVDNSGGAHNGRIYVIFYTWTGSQLQVQAAHSDTGGASWTGFLILSKQTNDQFFPWLSVDKTGRVGMTWLDRRDDVSNVKYKAYSALFVPGKGLKGGKTISGAQSNPLNDGFGGGFMGDYATNYWTPGGKKLYYTYCATYTGKCQDELSGFQTP
jgi:hypothetical protein